MAITTTIADITDLILQSYLSQTTTIADWQNFDSSLGIRSDSALSYAACIWPYQYQSNRIAALHGIPSSKSTWGIRLLISGDEASAVSLEAHKWARELDRLLLTVTNLQAMAREGADLSGTFEGVTVPTNTVLAIDRYPWDISVESNQSAGAVAIVSSRFDVTNA